MRVLLVTSAEVLVANRSGELLVSQENMLGHHNEVDTELVFFTCTALNKKKRLNQWLSLNKPIALVDLQNDGGRCGRRGCNHGDFDA